MSSAFWLLLYLAPLLALTAAVFGWLGWHWRGGDLRKTGTEPAVEETSGNAPPFVPDEVAVELELAAQELAALRETLQSAQAAAERSAQETTHAQEAGRALESEARRLVQDLDLLRGERDRVSSELVVLRQDRDGLATELSAARGDRDRVADELKAVRTELEQMRARPVPQEPVPAATPAPAAAPTPATTPAAGTDKPKRKRTTSSKPRTAAQATSLREKISSLASGLTLRQSAMAALTQEHADWQKRVSKLEAAMPADPAALGLARRSLSDSEKRLQTAAAEISRLQNQAAALQRVEQQNATLTLAADDDLTQIKGIKKVICEQLHAHGIRTWKQIAQWNDEEMHAFSELLAFKNRASREKWREQARALHEAAHGPLP